MARKRYSAEEIIGHLRTIEIETGKGLGIAEACRKLGITEQTYYRWKKEETKKWGQATVLKIKPADWPLSAMTFHSSASR